MINRSGNALQDYEQWHRHYNENIVDAMQLTLRPWHKSVLERLACDKPSGRILEIGCGNGDFTNYLASIHGVDIVGSDFSAESIKIAEHKKKQLGISTSKFLVAYAQALPFATESFDWVLSCECLEHVPDPQKLLQEAFRVLKPGGKIILTTENYSNAYAYYITYLKIVGKPFDSGSTVQPIEHFFVFWRIKKKFRKAGFQKLKTFSNQYVLLLLPSLSPATFTLENAKSGIIRFLLKPLGRRFTYCAEKPLP